MNNFEQLRLTTAQKKRGGGIKDGPFSAFQRLTAKSQPRDWRYWLRLLRLFIFALAAALFSLPLLMGALFTLALLYVPCSESSTIPSDYGYNWEDITLPARAGGSFRGYFMPGTNGATIIMPPPLSAGRSGRLREAAMLRGHGYAVFTFESRRCAGMGPLSLGYKEVDEVADVLDYLLIRPDVDPDRIGIFGFSSAGATAIMATARLPRLRAVVAEGGYGDFVENGLGTGSGHDPIIALFLTGYRWSTKVTYRLVTGLDMSVLSPVSVIGEIAPRPILLIYGSRETSLAGGRQQQAAAGDNAHLWIVTGAGHGNYLDVAPEAYEAHIVGFFDETLK